MYLVSGLGSEYGVKIFFRYDWWCILIRYDANVIKVTVDTHHLWLKSIQTNTTIYYIHTHIDDCPTVYSLSFINKILVALETLSQINYNILQIDNIVMIIVNIIVNNNLDLLPVPLVKRQSLIRALAFSSLWKVGCRSIPVTFLGGVFFSTVYSVLLPKPTLMALINYIHTIITLDYHWMHGLTHSENGIHKYK